jgi:hypothetical protein
VPNLLADRAFWVPFEQCRLNMRRLMYQTLIWPAHLRDESRRLGPALHLQDLESAADTLVDGVGGDVQLDRNFFRRQMLVDEPKTIQLTGA